MLGYAGAFMGGQDLVGRKLRPGVAGMTAPADAAPPQTEGAVPRDGSGPGPHAGADRSGTDGAADQREAARLAALRRYHVLDTPDEAAFDRIAHLASAMFAVPIADVSLIDADRQWLKASSVPDRPREAPRAWSFCARAIQSDAVTVVLDAREDERVRSSPFVTGRPHIRFYAGAPLRTSDGHNIGTLCVISPEPRASFSTEDQHKLRMLADIVVSELELRQRRREDAAVLNRLLEHSSDCIKVLDLDGGLRFMNEGGQALMEVDDFRACQGQPWPGLWQGEAQAALLAALDAARAGRTGRFEGQAATLKGTPKWWDVTVSPILGEDGRPERLLAISRDITGRKHAEDALRASEARLARLLATVPAGIVELDAAGRFVSANPAAERVLGAGPGGLVGRRYDDPAWEITSFDGAPIPPGCLPAAWALRSEQVLDYGHMLTALDGRRVALLVDVAPVRGADGRAEGALAAFQDITARQTAAEALRAGEARLHHTVEMNPQLPWTADPQGGITSFSGRWLDVTGLTRDAALGEGWMQVPHPDDRERMAAAWERAVATGEGYDAEARLRMADGAYRWWRARATARRDAAGAIVEWHGQTEDVHDRKRAEEGLRASEARFQAVANCIDHMVWSTRPDGHHDYYNQRWYDLTGVPEGSTDGEAWAGLFHPDDRERAWAAWRRSLATGEPYRVEYRLRHRSGRYRWVLGRAQPVRDETGRITRWYGTCTDIEEIVQAREVLARSRQELEREVEARTAELMAVEAALRQSQKMEAVGQLTGGIAHDFNNMLQAIGAGLEMAERRVEQGRATEAGRYVEGARRTVERAAALTHRLLAFARRQQLQPKPVNPGSLVAGMAELIRRTVGPDVRIEPQLRDGAWSVLCDPNQLENALLNLAVNARDAMPGGGRITITTRHVTLAASDLADQDGADQDGAAPGEYVEISVSDTGTGMDEATRGRAFEPFFTTKPIGQGTGLGLSQLYGFVQQSGGLVRLDSMPGQGTTVRLYLPRHEPAPADEAQAAPSSTPDAGAGEAVLLVEDEAEVRSLAAERLREGGYRVLEAADGPAALRLLRTGAGVDLLVTDVGLPGGLNGRQVAEAAREHRPGLPVLFITGYAGSALAEQLAPGMAVIGKPFALDALAVRVRTMLEAAPAQ